MAEKKAGLLVKKMTKFISEMIDTYLTFGWKCQDKKYMPLGSLFEFKIPLKPFLTFFLEASFK